MATLSRITADAEARRRSLIAYTQRAERAATSRQLMSRDLERVYAGAYLEWCTTIEGSIEKIFFHILLGTSVHPDPSVRALVSIRSHTVARNIVNGDRQFSEWLTADITRSRAKSFLSSGKPFVSALRGNNKSALATMKVVRNAIAHHSSHAEREFQRKILGSKSLPPNQRRPGGYLRGNHSIGRTRFEFLTLETLKVVKDLT